MTPMLRELQRAFADGIWNDAPAVLAHVCDGTFPAARHLQVYRHNTFANLTDALAADFPVVRRLVGEGFFAYAADSYIRRHPPRSGNLHDFGDGTEPRAAGQGCPGCGFGGDFAGFLATFPAAQTLPYLPDVARLEWAWQEAYHAGEAAPLSLDALAAVAPEHYGSLVFRLHPSARLLASDYPLLRIWQVNQPDFEGDPAVDLAEGTVRLLVVRRGLDVEIEPLTPSEYVWLAALAAGRPLAAATEAALAAVPDFGDRTEPRAAAQGRVGCGFDVAQAMQRHVRSVTLAGFDVMNDITP